MTTLQRCIELLGNNLVHYVHTNHPDAYTAREVAKAEHRPLSMFAKTVIFYSARGYGMAVLPADCVIDLDELAMTLNLIRIRLATEAEICQVCPDSEVGAMPPFGGLFDLPVYVDARLTEEKYIFFNAGTHRDTIHMSFADYFRVANPLITRFACPEVLWLRREPEAANDYVQAHTFPGGFF
jgi:Ala-tRNA(Pro) deacylase